MKQLQLPLDSIDCRYYQDCDAPMCPKDVNFGRFVWFPSEPVCRLREVPDWVLKQRKIAKLPGIDPEKYFTLRMLNDVERVSEGLEGIDPEFVGGEKLWLAKRSGKPRKKPVKKSGVMTDQGCEFEEEPSNPHLF